MRNITKIFFIDGDVRRRATISHYLSQRKIHAEPYESADELRHHAPDFGLMLVHDEKKEILKAIGHMECAGNWLPLIGYSENPNPRSVVKAIHAGAIDYLAWPFTPNEFYTLISDAESVAAPIGNRKMREYMSKKRVDRLSKREREVLQSVARGLSNQKIGEHLEISSRTVEIHRKNMLNKMGASNTSEAIRVAVEANLIN